MAAERYAVQVLGPPMGRLPDVLSPLTDERSPTFDPDLAARILRQVTGFNLQRTPGSGNAR